MSLDSVNRCRFELFVRELLSRFHNPHNRSIEVMFAVAFDRSVGALGFFGLVERRLSHIQEKWETNVNIPKPWPE